MKEEIVIDQNVVAFQSQNALQIINLQVLKSVDLNVFLVGIQDRIIIIYKALIHNLETDGLSQ